jgi:hypothetical protein
LVLNVKDTTPLAFTGCFASISLLSTMEAVPPSDRRLPITPN